VDAHAAEELVVREADLFGAEEERGDGRRRRRSDDARDG
jgi:hypothetical protein